MGTDEPEKSHEERKDATPSKNDREERVRAIRRLIRANRYDFENKLPVALTRLLNDVVD